MSMDYNFGAKDQSLTLKIFIFGGGMEKEVISSTAFTLKRSNLSEVKCSSVANMGSWDDFQWVWNFRWRRKIRGREVSLFNSSFEKISRTVIVNGFKDKMI
ncbi:hypothetical protein OIU74_007159 [Salix koriyanagi]|uniref:Uncharacterized protein n=1 Tax=Salix koriyanagi TaxID=2511006 RepID=A0A9Q0U2Z7_9ROSI|nr:hypothetical protein OIU74_007159 [Salix koriyanagi]